MSKITFKKFGLIAVASTILTIASSSAMATEYMDANWAKAACNAWNKSATLTNQLGSKGEAKWIANNAGRGYKLIQMYRSKCGAQSKVQLTIADKGGKAMCIYGGKPDGKKMNMAVDYIMNATDKNWTCMGKGSWGCGAMGAMMSGKLKFSGPKVEAMKVMTPFGAFLKLAGAVPGNKAACPAK